MIGWSLEKREEFGEEELGEEELGETDKLSCRTFENNQTQLSAASRFALVYNLCDFHTSLGLPSTVTRNTNR
jgi:hypothetical protein